MLRFCALGAVLLNQVSVEGHGWENYVKKYASEYYKGSSQHAQRYSEAHSGDVQTEGRGHQEDDDHETPAQAPERNRTSSGNSSAEEAMVAQAFAAAQEAKQQAKVSIKSLSDWDVMVKASAPSGIFADILAQGIVSGAEAQFSTERFELQERFDAAVGDLALANATQAAKAEKAAEALLKGFPRLDEAEDKFMRSSLRTMEKAWGGQVKGLWKKARKAAHHVYHADIAAAKAQRRAKVLERDYEHTILVAERASEHLLRQVEKAAEKAQLLAELQFESVQEHVQKAMDGIRNETQASQETRRQSLFHARDLEKAAREPVQEKAEMPAAFLAKGNSQGAAGSLLAASACVALPALAVFLVAKRLSGRVGSELKERPLLG